jgi:hypothetical protein
MRADSGDTHVRGLAWTRQEIAFPTKITLVQHELTQQTPSSRSCEVSRPDLPGVLTPDDTTPNGYGTSARAKHRVEYRPPNSPTMRGGNDQFVRVCSTIRVHVSKVDCHGSETFICVPEWADTAERKPLTVRNLSLTHLKNEIEKKWLSFQITVLPRNSARLQDTPASSSSL